MAPEDSTRRPKPEPEAEARTPAATPEEHQAFNATVGEAIRRARRERGWTQAALAERARLSPNYVARLERGELGPSLHVAHRLCEALRISLDALVVPPGAVPAKRSSRRRVAG
jgi:ribosome-binding protein aMBF1 (putative translation factor)